MINQCSMVNIMGKKSPNRKQWVEPRTWLLLINFRDNKNSKVFQN